MPLDVLSSFSLAKLQVFSQIISNSSTIMSIGTFSPEQIAQIKDLHSEFLSKVSESDPGTIDNEDSGEKVQLRRNLLDSEDFRREYRERALSAASKS